MEGSLYRQEGGVSLSSSAHPAGRVPGKSPSTWDLGHPLEIINPRMRKAPGHKP